MNAQLAWNSCDVLYFDCIFVLCRQKGRFFVIFYGDTFFCGSGLCMIEPFRSLTIILVSFWTNVIPFFLLQFYSQNKTSINGTNITLVHDTFTLYFLLTQYLHCIYLHCCQMLYLTTLGMNVPTAHKCVFTKQNCVFFIGNTETKHC